MTTHATIPKSGRKATAILEELEAMKSRDVPWKAGRAFGYVFDATHEAIELGKRAYMMYLTENGLDPTSFPSLLRLENEIVRMCANHVHGDERIVGNFTSGGTESIMLAVKAARDRARGANEKGRLELLVPVTAHAAFHKAASYLDLDIVTFAVDPVTLRADPRAAQGAITERTIFLAGSAPSYAHGVIDPIAELAAIAEENGIWMHVDACMGGVLLPYLEQLGEAVRPFDFRVPGVMSLSMDLHKYAFCPKGASVVLYRDKSLRRHQIFACSEWTGYTIVNATIQSSKSGGPLAGAWATLQCMGDEGFLELTRAMREATLRYVEGIGKIPGLRIMGCPDMTLLAFTSDEFPILVLPDLMKKRGWYVQAQLGFQGHRENVHLSVTASNVPHVAAFLADLGDAVEEARASWAAKGAKDDTIEDIARMASAIDPATLDEAAFQRLLSLAGGSSEPNAEINQILDRLPRALTKQIVIHFLNELFT